MDKVYVIYFDGKLFKEHGKKVGYLNKEDAQLVVDSEMRIVAHDLYIEYGRPLGAWYDIGEDNKQEWFDKARERFEIRTFVEEK